MPHDYLWDKLQLVQASQARRRGSTRYASIRYLSVQANAVQKAAGGDVEPNALRIESAVGWPVTHGNHMNLVAIGAEDRDPFRGRDVQFALFIYFQAAGNAVGVG